MSSTEQKNLTQPLADCCYTFGILPSLHVSSLSDYGLDTARPPFVGLGPTPHLGSRLRHAENPIAEAKTVLPMLDTARPTTRASGLLLRLCTDTKVLVGNQAVMRFVEGVLDHRWGLHFAETAAIKHARLHSAKICGMLAPGSYGRTARTESNCNRLAHRGDARYCRAAADTIDYLSKNARYRQHYLHTRQWCAQHRDATGYRPSYYKDSTAVDDFRTFDASKLHDTPAPKPIKQKWITTNRSAPVSFDIYHYGSTYFFKITNRFARRDASLLTLHDKKERRFAMNIQPRCSNELFILSNRDLQDICFLLQASSHIHLYWRRREYDLVKKSMRPQLLATQKMLWSLYITVMRICGEKKGLRNKLGVYFDVLQWRYLAWKSGDVFYNHSEIMANKIDSKGLTMMPNQFSILEALKRLPMDISVDLLGMYKASIYPEVDPFAVVCDQYKLHMSRHDTEWPANSDERIRFDETKSYMWYLATHVIHQRLGIWPGKIRQNVLSKEWHKLYKTNGIPSRQWRDAHDVDLTGAIVVADITDEQYLKQQDSACAPPNAEEYTDFKSLKKAPRRHRRKLLYAIQEPDLPSLPNILLQLNTIGGTLDDGYVGRVNYDPKFSTDIITGSRCERHKDAPRPFYAASPPWGCILSYFDGLCRDFLNHVPQSMLGKSTRQKFSDLGSTSATYVRDSYTFYMSDDKAKYSPHMDPHSQQLPADFFAELFDIPGIKAVGPVMYHNLLYYRVNGHLVSYSSNGTDREGMRGASNTWLEIVAQGLSTRLCRERGLIQGKSTFLSFIDDGLRKFSIKTHNRDDRQCMDAARLVIQDVIFGLKVIGRELSWDKTFISRDLFVILNEIVYDGAFISGGLKSFCTAGDLQLKEVMTAPDYEQLYFGKMRGAHGVGTPIDLCHYTYVFETTLQHYRMGAQLQDNKLAASFDYRLYCITPIALGGGGLRSPLQMSCNEVAGATKEGIGSIMRLGVNVRMVMGCVESLLNQQLAPLDPIDFMREPEQFHVEGPRLKTQRLAAEVRKSIKAIASNKLSKMYLERDEAGMRMLRNLGKAMMATGDVSAEEIRLIYAATPVAFIDEFIQKLASSATLAELLPRQTISNMRRMARRDLRASLDYFAKRCCSRELYAVLEKDVDRMLLAPEIFM